MNREKKLIKSSLHFAKSVFKSSAKYIVRVEKLGTQLTKNM